MAIYRPYPNYVQFTDFTPVVPDLYWNVYSAEERIRALCLEWVKLTAYVDGISDTINNQYDIIEQMKQELPELINDEVEEQIKVLISTGDFSQYVDAAILEVYSREIMPALASVENQIYLANQRIDNLAQLEDGSTTGDAELQDIRVAWDGTRYADAGTSVRTQVENVVKQITTELDLNLQPGYYTDRGVYHAPNEGTLEYYSQLIPIDNETTFIAIDQHTASHYLWLAYNAFTANGAAIRPGRQVVHHITKDRQVSNIKGSDILALYPTAAFIAFSWASFGDGTLTILEYGGNKILTQRVDALETRVNTIESTVDEIETISERSLSLSSLAANPMRYGHFWDHLFIDTINPGQTAIIPSESLENINLSAKMGFKVIELNCLNTSDGVPYVLHGRSRTFGYAFEHVDGTTDVTNIYVSTVTSQWIQDNIRFKSSVSKYRTPPLKAEEAFIACMQNGLIPLLGGSSTQNIRELCEKIMGKGNYIAYSYADERETNDAIIMRYHGENTAADTLAYCEQFGAPMIYIMSNSTIFSDADLREIIDTLHSHGYNIGVASCYLPEEETQRCMKLGMDVFVSGWHLNKVNGNSFVYNSGNDFSDFITNGTVSGGALTLESGQYIELPNISDFSYVNGASCDIQFNGEITLTFGKFNRESVVESDGKQYNRFSTYFLGTKPTCRIVANTTTVITNVTMKGDNY